MLQPTKLASTAYARLRDWAILEDGRTVGRIIEGKLTMRRATNASLTAKFIGVVATALVVGTAASLGRNLFHRTHAKARHAVF
jgi:hypothetical protein